MKSDETDKPTTFINLKVWLIMKNDIPMNNWDVLPYPLAGGAKCFAREDLAEKYLKQLRSKITPIGKRVTAYDSCRVEEATLSFEKYEDD